MRSPAAWMLVTNAGATGMATGMAVALAAHIGEGTRGNAVRRIGVRDASADVRTSAETGARLAYDVLQREKYLDRQVVAAFDADSSLANVHGRSAELAFAVAFALAAARGRAERCPPVAATGILGDDGAIAPVEQVPEKVAAALAALPPGALVLFPAGNDGDLTADIRRQAAARRITLVPSARLEEALRHLGLAISHTWLDAPFRGLEPFEFAHSAIFFGREKEIDDILSLLRRRAQKGAASVLVQGPSGSGKSSLVLAGVLPALMRRGTHAGDTSRYRWGVLRPRDARPDVDPAREREGFVRALSGAWCHDDPGGIPARLRNGVPLDGLEAGALLAWLAARYAQLDADASSSAVGATDAAAGGARYVLVLDQLEEWFAAPFQPATVAELCDALARLAERGVWLIATLTNAAAARLAGHAALAASFGVEGRYALNARQGPADLDAVIRAPAKAARLRFETGLDTEIFAAASGGGADVLPLLELLLTELYERRDRSRNELRMADYHAVGGLDGVVSARAEAVYAQCAPAEQAKLPELLWALETSGTFVPAHHAPDSPIQALIAAFVARRLLVQDEAAPGATRVRAAHDALLRYWTRAVEHRREIESDIRLWLDLVRESGQWARRERALIPAGPQLLAATALVARRRLLWTADDRPALDYVERSARQQSRRRVLGYALVGIPAAIAGASAAVAAYTYAESIHITRIRFDDIAVPAPNFAVAAEPYLRDKGIAVVDRRPARSTLVIRSTLGLYAGHAARPTWSENFLTQDVPDETAPVSYRLVFAHPVKSVILRRAQLFAATGSGVTHPAWEAHAFDEAGDEVASIQEALIRSFREVPFASHVLDSPDNALVRSVLISSDYRLDGRPFAGFHAVLINEIDLVR